MHSSAQLLPSSGPYDLGGEKGLQIQGSSLLWRGGRINYLPALYFGKSSENYANPQSHTVVKVFFNQRALEIYGCKAAFSQQDNKIFSHSGMSCEQNGWSWVSYRAAGDS